MQRAVKGELFAVLTAVDNLKENIIHGPRNASRGVGRRPDGWKTVQSTDIARSGVEIKANHPNHGRNPAEQLAEILNMSKPCLKHVYIPARDRLAANIL